MYPSPQIFVTFSTSSAPKDIRPVSVYVENKVWKSTCHTILLMTVVAVSFLVYRVYSYITFFAFQVCFHFFSGFPSYSGKELETDFDSKVKVSVPFCWHHQQSFFVRDCRLGTYQFNSRTTPISYIFPAHNRITNVSKLFDCKCCTDQTFYCTPSDSYRSLQDFPLLPY